MNAADRDLRAALTKLKHGLRVVAAEHHLELEAACEELLDARSPDEPQAVAARWRVLEAALREHLDAEEELVIPAYQLSAPEEGGELRTEHARIRDLLDEIEQDVRHQSLRADHIRALLDLLRAHSAREDASIYPWVERNLSVVARRQLFVRFAHWLRRPKPSG